MEQLISTYFVFNNIQVHPFILQDRPLPGFEVINWSSWALGELYKLDIVEDVGFLPDGSTRVFGQLWKANDESKVKVLESCFGTKLGIAKPIKINLNLGSGISTTVEAKTFALTEIKPTYEKLNDGRWRF